MLIKIVHHKQIHIVQKDQSPLLQNLFQYIHKTFKNTPQKYYLHYHDQEGKDVMVVNEQDYSIILEMDCKNVKVYIQEIKDELLEDKTEEQIGGNREAQRDMPINDQKMRSTEALAQKIETSKELEAQMLQKKQQNEVEKVELAREEIVVGEQNRNNSVRQVQHMVKCGSCSLFPISGIRYKCLVCKDFDLCSGCEENEFHQHAFIKIRTLEQTPTEIQVKFKVIAEPEEPIDEKRGEDKQEEVKQEEDKQEEVKQEEERADEPAVQKILPVVVESKLNKSKLLVIEIASYISDALGIQIEEALHFAKDCKADGMEEALEEYLGRREEPKDQGESNKWRIVKWFEKLIE